MLLNTSDFKNLPGIISAGLSESADAASTLNLAWRGYGPEWMRWMEPVTVMHRGRVLFHGRVTSFERGNDASNLEASCTVSNALWLLDNLPLGAQVAEARAANTDNSGGSSGTASRRVVSFRDAGQEALQSWTALAESCRASAPLWTVDANGAPQENGVIYLDVTRANFSSGAVFKRDKAITTWTALLEMKSANPDATFRMNYITGAVETVAIEKAELMAWDLDAMETASCVGISPQYDRCLTGVALVVMWDGGSVLRVYPDSVEPGDMGVKLFSAKVENSEQAERQAEYMMRQLRRYYEAVNVLQHGGSVTAMLDEVEESPLCHRLNIVGTGTHESWHDMATVVSAVEWDFLSEMVELQLGAQIDDPEISEMTFPDNDGGGGDESDSSGGDDWDDDISSDDESEEESGEYDDESTTWDYTTTWGETTAEESTTGDLTTGDVSTTLDNESTTAPQSTTAQRSTDDAPSTTGGTAPGSSPGTRPGSSPGGSSPGGGDDGTDRWTTTSSGGGSGSPGSQPGTSPGSQPGSSPGSQPGSSPGTTPVGCDCAQKWTENSKKLESIEGRLSALEKNQGGGSNDNDGTEDGSGGGGGSGTQPGADYESRITELERKIKELTEGQCSCVEQVKSAIESALAGAPATMGGNSSSVVQGNANGTITVTTTWSY